MTIHGNMIRFSGAGLLAIAAATGILAPATASAQTAPAPEDGQTATGGDIIVTANKREERIVDVASAVSALSGEELVNRNLPQIEDFASQVPGLAVQQGGNRATRIILRGLNAGGAGATVATVLDEAALSYSSSTSNGAIDIANFDTYDLNRIEVLRGPQGTLYGAAAEGGLIKYVTNAPNLTDFSGSGEGIVEGTNDGGIGWTGRGYLNLPIVNDRLALRVTGFYKDVQGYIDNTRLGVNDANNGRRYGGRVQLLWQATDTLSIKISALLQDQHFNDGGNLEFVGAALSTYTPPTATDSGSVLPAGALAIANGGRLQQNGYRFSPSDNRTYLFSGVINWEAGFADIMSATSYGAVKSSFSNDATSSIVAPGLSYGDFFSNFVFGRPITIAGRQTNDLIKFNQELRLSSKPDTTLFGLKFDWQAGAFYSHEDITFNQFYDFVEANGTVITAPIIPGGSTLPANYDEISLFGTVKLHFSDRFNIEVGGRHTWNWQDSTVNNFAGFLNGPVDTFNAPRTSSESNFTWSVAPQYRINDDTAVYVRIATGYRPGGPTLAVPGVPPGVLPNSYLSDSTINYEIGFKGAVFDRKLSVDVAAFYIDWTDIQIITTIDTPSGPFGITGNAGTARSKGIEWSLAWTPTRGLTISDVGSYVDATLTRDALTLGGRNGFRLPYVPAITNSVNIDYRWDLNDHAKAYIGGTWSYTGDRRTGYSSGTLAYGYILLPSYSTFSAQAGVDFGGVRAELFVRNLTDDRSPTTFGSSGGANNTGQGQIVQPRTIGAKLSFDF